MNSFTGFGVLGAFVLGGLIARQHTDSGEMAAMRKITPVIVVDSIETALPFWRDRLGFAVTVEVPHEDRLGFVILQKDGVEVMYQSRASIAADIPSLGDLAGDGIALFIEVGDVGAIEAALGGIEPVMPRRRTFYGMDEIGVREPGGNVVIFAQNVGAE